MEGKALIMDEKAMSRAINRISYEIIERGKGAEDLCIIGIVSRGVELAQRIADKIKSVEQREIPVGTLDITPYRDDVPRDGPPPGQPDRRRGARPVLTCLEWIRNQPRFSRCGKAGFSACAGKRRPATFVHMMQGNAVLY